MTLRFYLAFSLSLLAYAQQKSEQAPPRQTSPPPFTNLLPADSPFLYRQFFYFHSSFLDRVDKLITGKPATAAADLDQKAAAQFGLTVAGHQQLAPITTSVAHELKAIDAQEHDHANMRARYEQPPLTAVLQQLETKRADAVTRGIDRLQRSLPADVWNATRAYVNGPYRGGIHVR